MSQLKTYFPIFIWPGLVFTIHLFSEQIGFYAKHTWLDTPMHFLGGAAIAASSYFLFTHLENNNELKATPLVKVFLALAITALAAVLWEFLEYASDTLLHTFVQSSIFDTMKDFAMGLLGASVVSLLQFFIDKTSKNR